MCPNMNGKTPVQKGIEIRSEIIKLLNERPGITRSQVSENLDISLDRTIWYLDSMTFHEIINCHKENNRLYYFAKEKGSANTIHQLTIFDF
jgi:predicted transcriptional regulator